MIAKEKKGVKVTFQTRESDEINDLSADVVLVATGRKPLTKGLNLENIGVELNLKGKLKPIAIGERGQKIFLLLEM